MEPHTISSFPNSLALTPSGVVHSRTRALGKHADDALSPLNVAGTLCPFYARYLLCLGINANGPSVRRAAAFTDTEGVLRGRGFAVRIGAASRGGRLHPLPRQGAREPRADLGCGGRC